MKQKTYEVIREDETLDEIVFNYYGASFGYLEKVLDVNDFLVSEELYLPVGTTIILPKLEEQAEEKGVNPVKRSGIRELSEGWISS